MKLKIVIATMVKDEDDIIEKWINYHGKIFGYSNIHIVDNFSKDNTFKICNEYKKHKKINLYRKDDYKKKGIYMTEIMNNNKCDIFFPIDIDEFIVYLKDNKINTENINDYFEILINYYKKNTYFKCDYIIPVKTIESKNIFKKFSFGFLNQNYDNTRKTFIYTKNLQKPFIIDHGNHMAGVSDYIVSKICLVHYHYRSHEQKYKKSVNNALGLGIDINIKKLENKDKNELLKLENIISKKFNGRHHARNLYEFFSGKIKSFDKPLVKKTDNLISLELIREKVNM